MSQLIDNLIALAILLSIGLWIYSNMTGRTITDTIKMLIEKIKEIGK